VRVLTITAGIFLLFGAMSASGQKLDRHLTSDSARVLYEKSAYAHGYIHGYEDGFHNADIDIHMGRGERRLNLIKDYRDPDGGYQSHFGDKQYFRSGYKQGFREGYSDSIHGGQFRAIEQTEKVAAGLTKGSAVDLKGKEFDRAFSTGYDAGRENGIGSSRDIPDFEHVANVCQSRLPRSEAKHPNEYCDAYTRGYTLGFDNGQASRMTRRTQTAKR
jgi:hypothetical protein